MGEENTGKETEPILTLEFGPENGGEIEFYNFDELEEFITKEQDYWSWLEGVRDETTENEVERICKSQLQITNNTLQKRLTELKSVHNNDSKDFNNGQNKFKSTINKNYIENRNAILSESKRAGFIEECREKYDAETCVYILGFWIEKQKVDQKARNQNDDDYAKAEHGKILAGLFDLGLDGQVEPAELAVDELKEKWQEDLNRKRAKYSDFEEDYSDLTDTIQEAVDTKVEEFDEEIEKRKEEFDNIEETYENELSLKSSNKFWDKKKEEHAKSWKCWAGALTVFLVSFVGLMWWLIATFWADLEKFEPGLFETSIVLLFTGIGAWIIRLLSKNLMAHLHLQQDAAERQTIVKTYLALLKNDEDPVTADERKLVLQEIFRNANSGLINGEDGPKLPAEQLIKIVEGSR